MTTFANIAAAILNAAADRAGLRARVSCGDEYTDDHIVSLDDAERICEINPDWRIVAVVDDTTTVWERA